MVKAALLIAALEELTTLAGEPVGGCESDVEFLSPAELLHTIRVRARKAREGVGERHREHSDVLTTLLSEVSLFRPGLSSLAEKQACHAEAKRRLRVRRDAMHEIVGCLQSLANEAWLVSNATAGDPPDHVRLNNARTAFVRKIEERLKPAIERLDDILFGCDFED